MVYSFLYLCERQVAVVKQARIQRTSVVYTHVFHIFFKLLLYVLYLVTLRQQAGFFIFIIRCCFYTIIVGFTGPDRVWRIYITVVASFTYFMSYMNGFINSYKVLLKAIFKISKKDKIDERMFNQIIDNCYSVQKRLFFLVVK